MTLLSDDYLNISSQNLIGTKELFFIFDVEFLILNNY